MLYRRAMQLPGAFADAAVETIDSRDGSLVLDLNSCAVAIIDGTGEEVQR